MKRILIALILTVCLSSINLFARDIYRGDIQIQGGFGAESYKFATTVNSISSTTTADTFGFAYDITCYYLNIQGQFLPNKRVSPVAGYRLISGTSNDGFYWGGQGYAGSDKLYKGETAYTSNDFYAGVTINW